VVLVQAMLGPLVESQTRRNHNGAEITRLLSAPQGLFGQPLRRNYMIGPSKVLLGAFLSATALAVGAAAYSQTAGSLWDSTQLPETRGVVKQYTLTPRGDVDGLILNDGTEVTLPPHLTNQIVFAVRPGDAVTVRGLKARALPLIDAALVTNSATGVAVVERGPRAVPGGPPPNRRSAAGSSLSCMESGARSTARCSPTGRSFDCHRPKLRDWTR
jgi:hypothetical protein